jgi:hypothetical protein
MFAKIQELWLRAAFTVILLWRLFVTLVTAPFRRR